MFNANRQLRECNNQLLEFDPDKQKMSLLKTYGERANARRSHCAAMYEDSMVGYGG